MTPLELLAPAKDVECGLTAINCGADAVYIGAPRFGARLTAGNSVRDIERLVRYAHRYHAKVYVALNTLLTDKEIPAAAEILGELYDGGVDGAIIQDMGLLEADLPPIPLIASTQVHNADPEKLLFLEKVGFKRAILARELSLHEIRVIREKTDSIELECFVHGALCVSYSGQCYLSYALGNRSGNRGACAQPCRKFYRLTDGRDREIASGHLLSIKDMNHGDHLEALRMAGVSAFKIEGRLKDKRYVANVVSYYRQKLDAIRRSQGLAPDDRETITVSFTPDPNKTFNRGYTDYLGSDPAPMGSIDTPKMTGEPIGTIIALARNRVRFDRRTALHPGDGICFFDRQHRLRGTRVQSLNGEEAILRETAGMALGTMLYRNRDHRWTEALKAARMVRKIRVSMRVGNDAKRLYLEIRDGHGHWVRVALDIPWSVAEKPEQAKAAIRRQLEKTGESEFVCDRIDLDLTTVPFVPVSALNRWRREALAQLRAIREQHREKPSRPIRPNEFPYPEKRLGYEGNVINDLARRFYRRHGVQSIDPGAESGASLVGKKVMTSRYCILRELHRCPGQGVRKERPGPLFLQNEEGDRLQLAFDCKHCRMSVFLIT